MSERQKAELEMATIACFAEFIGQVTGLKPPVERRAFPPEFDPALKRFTEAVHQIYQERQP